MSHLGICWKDDHVHFRPLRDLRHLASALEVNEDRAMKSNPTIAEAENALSVYHRVGVLHQRVQRRTPRVKQALKTFRLLYGRTSITDFGPLSLKAGPVNHKASTHATFRPMTYL